MNLLIDVNDSRTVRRWKILYLMPFALLYIVPKILLWDTFRNFKKLWEEVSSEWQR